MFKLSKKVVMYMMRVSIIVPVYNACKYIGQCINSVLQQSYQDWELLLMDDGSTDGSGRICDEYKRKDNRIIVVHKENSGVSDTRNQGLDLATGKYVIFLDSDDYWCNKCFLEEFVLCAEMNSLDVVRGEYVEVDSIGEIIRDSPFYEKRKIYTGEIIDNITFQRRIVLGEYFSVLCLYKKDYIAALRFNTQRVFLEDAEFYISLFQKEGRFLYFANKFYSYRKHSEGVSVKYIPQKMKDAFDFSRYCFQQSELVDLYEYKVFCAEEGIKNFLFDISVISDKVYKSKALSKWNCEHRLYELKRELLHRIITFSLYQYCVAFLPLPMLIYYYYLRHRLRVVLKGY